MVHSGGINRHTAFKLRIFLRRGVCVCAEHFNGEFVDFGYVMVEPIRGCFGVFREVFGGVFGDPFVVVSTIVVTCLYLSS